VLLRAFIGGALAPDAVGKENAVLESSVRALLKETLQVQAAPRMTAVHRYPKSMPQYHVGHLERVERIEKEVAHLRGLAVTGNWSHGVGIPHCIRQAELAAEKLCSGLITPS
jgi:oxygen-dependent protoporphyrinogen oxidase